MRNKLLAEYCSNAELLLNVLDPVVTQVRDKSQRLTFRPIVGTKSNYKANFTKFTKLIINTYHKVNKKIRITKYYTKSSKKPKVF